MKFMIKKLVCMTMIFSLSSYTFAATTKAAELSNNQIDKAIDALTTDVSEFSQSKQHSVVDELKSGLYKLREEVAKLPEASRKSYIVERMALQENREVIEVELSKALDNNKISEEEYSIATNYLDEHLDFENQLLSLSDDEAISFLDYQIQILDQANFIVEIMVFCLALSIVFGVIVLAAGIVISPFYGLAWVLDKLFDFGWF